MELDFDVRITTPVLFDFLLRHTYTSLQGILGVIIGLLAIGYYVYARDLMFLIVGIVVLIYLPLTLLMRAVRQAKTNPAFKNVLHYHLDEAGLEVSQGQASQRIGWAQVLKVTGTKKSIFLYTSPVNATILPRGDLGEREAELFTLLEKSLPPEKLKVKALLREGKNG